MSSTKFYQCILSPFLQIKFGKSLIIFKNKGRRIMSAQIIQCSWTIQIYNRARVINRLKYIPPATLYTNCSLVCRVIVMLD